MDSEAGRPVSNSRERATARAMRLDVSSVAWRSEDDEREGARPKAVAAREQKKRRVFPSFPVDDEGEGPRHKAVASKTPEMASVQDHAQGRGILAVQRRSLTSAA